MKCEKLSMTKYYSYDNKYIIYVSNEDNNFYGFYIQKNSNTVINFIEETKLKNNIDIEEYIIKNIDDWINKISKNQNDKNEIWI